MELVKRRLFLLLLLSILVILSGCSNTATNQSPSANFTAAATNDDEPLKVSFDASTSSDPDGEITGQKTWDGLLAS